MKDQLIQQLRLLKLPGIREHLEARIMEAEANNLSHIEFLSMLMTDEIDLRTTRRIDRLLRRASLGTDTTLETFDWSFNPSINAKLIKGLATCRFIERSEGVILLGPTGTGKTHLAKAIAHRACRLMFSVAYYSANQLFADMAMADLQNRLPVVLKRLLKVDLLIVDDFGLKSIDQTSAERFYAIVDGRFRPGASFSPPIGLSPTGRDSSPIRSSPTPSWTGSPTPAIKSLSKDNRTERNSRSKTRRTPHEMKSLHRADRKR